MIGVLLACADEVSDWASVVIVGMVLLFFCFVAWLAVWLAAR